MSEAAYPLETETLSISSEAAKSLGKKYATEYQSAQPYPHICIDGFLPEPVLDKVLSDLTTLPDSEDSFNRAQENKKSSYLPERLPFYTKSLFYAFNSRPFILFLEELTGIPGLIPDPFFSGAGIHKIANGGHLDIHADFNCHSKLYLERRLNVLIYLNKEWQENWGGSFEIWNKDMTKKEESFLPIFNRMVVFSTGSDTFHGNPIPVNNPKGDPRLSIALYYYTATWNETRKGHSTLFRPRPSTADKVDYTEKRREMLRQVVPPILYRRLIGPLSRLGF
jgi:Rps23 Pro-64 3,4-dihydroxylase Tpa1-like proline 4-hydroxylase